MRVLKCTAFLLAGWFNSAAMANTLSLNIENEVAAIGTLHVQLFQSETPFASELKDWSKLSAFAEKNVPINGQNISVEFTQLPSAWYAVRLYVDENANQTLDLSRAGIPKEAVGFSNNPMLFRGKPAINKTSFQLTNNQQSDIRLVKDKRK
ncbi:DUF2141 domain-containing protein [Pseudoalteromonas sp. G4]|uniref:DUF2141 domain-containing protein n=1 Tax=Pseudoalteromonas sp. G4 TaxID=2992761 RepID=UPI00237E80F6|nr:DUF2141 domain-containing protein [Pseudoalteromonas sp. G4]MDE3272900.1 DUF2141 domain-containing protein [Pseudoalteromonas sp. G4]